MTDHEHDDLPATTCRCGGYLLTLNGWCINGHAPQRDWPEVERDPRPLVHTRYVTVPGPAPERTP